MILKTLQGRKRKLNIRDYLVQWRGASLSKFQRNVKLFLEPYWSKKMIGEEVPMVGSKMRFDLFNATDKIVVEVMGEGHTDPEFYLHESAVDYLNQLRRDAKKADWCELNGYTLVEVFPGDMPLTPEFFKTKYDIEL